MPKAPSPFKKLAFYFLLPLFCITLLYQILFHPRVLEALLIRSVAQSTNARLRLRVERASLVYGFTITDIRLEPADQTAQPLLSMKRFRLSWFLPAFLAGHIGIRELSLDSPRIYLKRSGGLWNWQRAFGLDSKKEPERKEPSPLPRAVSLFTDLRVYLNLRIRDLSIEIEDYPSNHKETPWSLRLRGLNLRLAVLTHPFSEIPLDAKALSLLRTTILAVNPFRPIHVEYRGRQRMEGNWKLRLLLFQENERQASRGREFALHLSTDLKDLAFLDRKGRLLGRAGLYLNMDSAFDAGRDRLLLHRMDLGYGPERWISMQARLDDISIPERRLLLRFAPTQITLQRIDRLVSILSNAAPGQSMLRGTIWIDPILAGGRLDDLKLQGGLRARQVLLRAGSLHRLDDLALDWDGKLDFYHDLLSTMKPADYDASTKPAFGILKYFQLSRLRISYNGTRAAGTAHLDSGHGLRSDLSLQNFDWGQYFPEFMQGKSSARIRLHAPESFRSLDFAAKIDLIRGRYFLDRSRSGFQNLQLSGTGRIAFGPPLSIRLDDIRLQVQSLTGQQLVHLKGGAELALARRQDYRIRLSALQVHYNRLKKLLPGSIRDRLRPFDLYLSKGISLRSQTDLSIQNGRTQLRGSSYLSLPYLKLENLKLGYNMDFGKKGIQLREVQLSGLKGALSAHASGRLDSTPAGYKPDLAFQLRLAQKDYLQVHENITMQGLFDMRFRVSHKEARGRIKVSDLNLSYHTGNCATLRTAQCRRWVVRGLRLDLPVQHNLDAEVFSILSNNPARQYSSSFGAESPNNFAIQWLFASHDPQGHFHKDGFYYIGSPQAKAPGLLAALNYHRNVLLISRLKLSLFKAALRNNKKYWKPSGTIHGRDLYFNLADLKKEHMEANAMLQLKDLDLEPFLPESRSSYDGIISADVRLLVSSLKNPLYHMDAYLSVYRISQEFSGFVTRIIMPAQIVAMLARNILEIPSIKIELKGGLVYSSIKVKRARVFPGVLIAPGSDEIKQERMPLAQFLSRAKSEVGAIEERGIQKEGEP